MRKEYIKALLNDGLPKYDKWQENVTKFNNDDQKGHFSSTIFHEDTIYGDVKKNVEIFVVLQIV
jgi:hypothetical protein